MTHTKLYRTCEEIQESPTDHLKRSPIQNQHKSAYLYPSTSPSYGAGWPILGGCDMHQSEDNEKKSFQVAMMDKIYSSASKTILRLGEGEKDTHLAFELINTIPANARGLMETIVNALRPQLWYSTTTNLAAEIFRAIMSFESNNEVLHQGYMHCAASPTSHLAQIGA